MNEQQALSKMIAPGTRRKGKYRDGVIQIWVTRHCDKSCFGCTQGSNLRHKQWRTKDIQDHMPDVQFQDFISPEQFEQAVLSLKGYYGVVGVFGGNPAIHPEFELLCEILSMHIPYDQRGLWCNNPLTLEKAATMRRTFNPAHSNLNVHLDQGAYDLFKQGWPECHPVGLQEDSRHSPPYVAMKDVVIKECGCQELKRRNPDTFEGGCATCGGTEIVPDEERIWDLISDCDINKHWSAMIGVFRGQLRAWFCEIAGAQAMLHQHEPEYPDTGMKVDTGPFDPPEKAHTLEGQRVAWWQLPMWAFAEQVRKHCFDCGIPLRLPGENAQTSDLPRDPESEGPDCPPTAREQVSHTHSAIYNPKRSHRRVEVITDLQQIGTARLQNVVRYLQNAKSN